MEGLSNVNKLFESHIFICKKLTVKSRGPFSAVTAIVNRYGVGTGRISAIAKTQFSLAIQKEFFGGINEERRLHEEAG